MTNTQRMLLTCGAVTIFLISLFGAISLSTLAANHARIADAEGIITNSTDCTINCYQFGAGGGGGCIVEGTIQLAWTYEEENYTATIQTPMLCAADCCDTYVIEKTIIYVYIDESSPWLVDRVSTDPKTPPVGYVLLAALMSLLACFSAIMSIAFALNQCE